MSDEHKPGSGGDDPNHENGVGVGISEEALQAIFSEVDMDDDQKKALTEKIQGETLAAYNKANGKNFKSWDEAIKSRREAEKALTEQGRKPKEEAKPGDEPDKRSTAEAAGETKISPVIKNLYFKNFPEAAEIWSEVEQAAKDTGKDPFELYESSKYFQGEAKARYEVKQSENAAKHKIETPSGLITGGNIDFKNIDLSNPAHLKWLKEKPERRDAYNAWILKESFKR